MTDASNTTTPPSYTIATVRDFLLVPVDRRDDCLHEFAAWLGCFDLLHALVEKPAHIQSMPEAFVWVDDGELRLEASFSVGDKKIVVIDGTMKERAHG